MVDLVKIRKKAKKVAEKVVEAVSSGAAADPAAEKPATESVAAPLETNVYGELQTIEDLLTGSDAEKREGLDRLHQLIRRLRPR